MLWAKVNYCCEDFGIFGWLREKLKVRWENFLFYSIVAFIIDIVKYKGPMFIYYMSPTKELMMGNYIDNTNEIAA